MAIFAFPLYWLITNHAPRSANSASMANVFGFGNWRKNDDESKDDPSNRLYVGGASSHGGGSGLSVIAGGGDEDSDAVSNIIARAQAQ